MESDDMLAISPRPVRRSRRHPSRSRAATRLIAFPLIEAGDDACGDLRVDRVELEDLVCHESVRLAARPMEGNGISGGKRVQQGASAIRVGKGEVRVLGQRNHPVECGRGARHRLHAKPFVQHERATKLMNAAS
jgi:hypothetical protein